MKMTMRYILNISPFMITAQIAQLGERKTEVSSHLKVAGSIPALSISFCFLFVYFISRN